MQIKKPRDLTLRDLPNIESPFAAASKIDFLANRPGSPLTWDQSLVQDSPFVRPLDQQTFVNHLREKLEKGELLMVYGVTDGRPFNPLVAWHESGTLPARWQVEKSVFGLNLEHKVDQLNDWRITPEQIDHLGPGGVGHLSASSFDSDLRAQKAEERAQAKQHRERSLSTPIGAAAAVAPLAAVAQESDEETKPEKKLHIEVGIFTDGTGNNAGNIKIFKQELRDACLEPHKRGDIDEMECKQRLALMMGASYANGESNVSKLFNLYEERQSETDSSISHTLRVYQPGVGTKTGSEDVLWSSATGLGEAGILEQVSSAFRSAGALIGGVASGRHVEQLTVDLFGFSRGAAAARHAASEIAKGQEGLFGDYLKRYNAPWPKHLTIRFVGLFDTVAGIVNLKRGDFLASNEKTAPINIYLDPDKVQNVTHLIASDECRENFALNSIRNPDGYLPNHFSEITIPGAHSDVGGGYHLEQQEDVRLARALSITDRRAERPEETMEWDNLHALLESTEAEGWIGEKSLSGQTGNAPYLGIRKTSTIHPSPYGRVDLSLEMTRQLRGEYSRIGLRLMRSLAVNAGVKFTDLDDTDKNVSLPDELLPIYDTLSKQIEQGEKEPSLPESQIALLKQRYIHHSDNFNSIEFMVGETLAELEIPWELAMPFAPAEGRVRIVHPNKPEKA